MVRAAISAAGGAEADPSAEGSADFFPQPPRMDHSARNFPPSPSAGGGGGWEDGAAAAAVGQQQQQRPATSSSAGGVGLGPLGAAGMVMTESMTALAQRGAGGGAGGGGPEEEGGMWDGGRRPTLGEDEEE